MNKIRCETKVIEKELILKSTELKELKKKHTKIECEKKDVDESNTLLTNRIDILKKKEEENKKFIKEYKTENEKLKCHLLANKKTIDEMVNDIEK